MSIEYCGVGTVGIKASPPTTSTQKDEARMAPQVRDLEREVFGGSESELSSDEGEEYQSLPQKRRSHSRSRDAGASGASAGGGADESSGGDSEDDYTQDSQRRSGIGKAKKRSKGAKSGGRGADGEPGRSALKKRKRKAPVEVDLSELTPEEASKRRLDMQIEAILKPKKGSRQKKRKANEEVLDSFADDEVARLREAMNAAADEDIRSNNDKLPAVAKLRLLPEAMETLRKASLAQSMIDNNLLEGVRRWLEPLPDRSLPALNIQRELFNVVRKMEFIDSAVLKESGLGRIVNFYTRCKRVNADIGRIASDLISAWSRPIIKRSASYRDRIVPTAQDVDGGDNNGNVGGGSQQKPLPGLNAILAKARAEGGDSERMRKHVHIPQRSLGSYTVAPKMNAGVGRGNQSIDDDVERRRKNAERLRMLTRKVGNK